MIIKYLFPAALALFLAGSAVAQPALCGTDYLHEQQMLQNPDYARHYNQDRNKWAERQAALKSAKIIVSGSDTTYELPVVIHVVHSGEPVGSFFNPSVAAIDSMLDYLNESWSATWPGYPTAGSGGVNMQIRFARARRTPDCNPSDGVNRVDGRVLPNYDANGVIYSSSLPGPRDSALKSLSRWPASDYYNIWIVKYLDGTSGYYAGYASYPGPNLLDGTVIAAKYIRPLTPGTSDFWYTIPHELGHAFGLRHTFIGSSGAGSCPPDADCAVDGDGICDTEPHEFNDVSCPSGTNMCTGKPYAGVEHNMMNYTNCFDRFTPKQKERVLFSLKQYRMGLINSLGALAPDAGLIPPAAACVPKTAIDSRTDTGPHNVSLADMQTHSFGYITDGRKGYIDRTCIQQAAHLQKGKTYTLSVSVGYMPERVKAWIDYNNDGIFQNSEVVLNHIGTFTTPNEIHSASLLVPATAVLKKPLRMRIMSDAYDAAEPDPCGDLQYGQTEDYSVIIEEPSAIIAAATAPEIKIYPNPAKDLVYIETSTPAHVSIWSMDGRCLLQLENSRQADLSALSNGLYLLRLTDPDSGIVLGQGKILKYK